MYFQAFSAALVGIEAIPIRVEADVSDGLPIFQMVGLLSSEAKEAKERARSSLRNAGYRIPPKRITVNLSPADVRKDGTAFDLPISLALLSAFGYLAQSKLEQYMIVGEVSLNGNVNAVNGILPIVMSAREAGFKRCLVPMDNIGEAAVVNGVEVMGVRRLTDAVAIVKGERLWNAGISPETSLLSEQDSSSQEFDFCEVAGQQFAKRAVEVAVAGMHNLLLIGPPGSGKSMLANRIPGIMPPLTMEESLEITKVYSVCGLLPEGKSLVTKRPFRAPHHTIPPTALLGGGRIPHPGEVTLASGGVLFLDELTEYQSGTIEMLRQPLENRKIAIHRLNGTYEYPCNFMMVAAMNACHCGFFPDRGRCRCTPSQIKHYLGRLSKPLLDRMDIMAETVPTDYATMSKQNQGESSHAIRERILSVRKIQQERYAQDNILYNSELTTSQLSQYCHLGEKEEKVMKQAFLQMELSGRGYHRILKVARTIADLDGKADISTTHLIEALGYRRLKQKYWETK